MDEAKGAALDLEQSPPVLHSEGVAITWLGDDVVLFNHLPKHMQDITGRSLGDHG